MVDPSLAISIDRTALELPPLVFVGSGDDPLGVTAYREPALQSRITYAPPSGFIHGDVPLSWSWQQSLLDFSFTTQVDTEAESRTLVAEVSAAITQGLRFPVTITVSDAPAETWSCNPGSLESEGGRTLVDMKRVRPVWAVSLPCYPVRTVA